MAIIGYDAAFLYASLFSQISFFELVLFGLISGIVILGSILLHELMHSIIAQRNGLPVKEIEMYIFGGVSKISGEPNSPGSEFRIAVVGPLTSIILGGILFGLTFLGIPNLFVNMLFFYSGIVNIGLGIFNFLPAFPMDGGRILRAFLWKRRENMISATKTASRVGAFVGYILMGIGIFQVLFQGSLGGLWLVFMGNMLHQNAKNSYIQTVYLNNLEQFKSHEIMGSAYPIVKYSMPLNEAISEFFMRFRRNHFLVSNEDKIVGVIHMEKVQQIPYIQREKLIVGDIMETLDKIPSVEGAENGHDAFTKLSNLQNKADMLIVREEESGDIIGFIEPEDFRKAMSFIQSNYER